MDTDSVRAVVQRLFDEFYNGGKPGIAHEIMSSDVVLHNMGTTITGGPEVFKQRQEEQLAGVPDLHMALEDLLIEGDRAAYRWTMTGTQTGSLRGIPPTDRKFAMQGMSVMRVVNGQIAEAWQNYNSLGLLQQLGIVPAPRG